MALLCALVTAVGCKPASEPAREGQGSSAIRSTAGTPEEEGSHRLGASLGTLRIVLPDASTGDDAVLAFGANLASPVPTEAEAPDGASESPSGLTPPVLTSVRAPPDEAGSRAAKAHNATGLRHYRNLDLAAAASAFRDGLAAWPGHPYSNYNLACVLALQNRHPEAIDRLRVLAALEPALGLPRLHAARTDLDFEGLRSDETFRRLTGYVPVLVVPAPAIEGTAIVNETVQTLRDAKIPAQAGDVWNRPVDGHTLVVRRGDEPADHMADEVEDAFAGQVRRRESSRLAKEHPVVLVLSHGQAAGEPPKESKPEDFLGKPLTAVKKAGVHHFQLKEARFFTWEHLAEDGTRVERTGSYHLRKGRIYLDFQQTTERPGARGGPPAIEVERGRRTDHRIRAEGDTLHLGDLAFRLER